MKVKDVIRMLLDSNLEDTVEIYDPDMESFETVTGMVYGGKSGIVQLTSDTMQE